MLRWDPFRDLDRMTDPATRQARPLLAMDAVRDEHEVTVYIDAPGVSVDDVDVSVEKNELTVTIERRWRDEDKQILSSERPQGQFSRRLVLSDALDVDQLQAEMTDGVLILSIPVAERSKPRKIDVSSSQGGGQSIDTGHG